MEFCLECRPAFNYGRDPHTAHVVADGVCFESPELSMGLGTRATLHIEGNSVVSQFTLHEGQTASFTFGQLETPDCGVLLGGGEAEELIDKTEQFWRQWLSQCTYHGRWREMVQRSALTLLTFEPTGALVAAPTCSLPEGVGGERNWDYRYTWIRDAAFTLYGLMRIGFTDAAREFMGWLEARCHELNPDGVLAGYVRS